MMKFSFIKVRVSNTFKFELFLHKVTIDWPSPHQPQAIIDTFINKNGKKWHYSLFHVLFLHNVCFLKKVLKKYQLN